jgi:hypothetical protein
VVSDRDLEDAYGLNDFHQGISGISGPAELVKHRKVTNEKIFLVNARQNILRHEDLMQISLPSENLKFHGPRPLSVPSGVCGGKSVDPTYPRFCGLRLWNRQEC